MAICRKYQKRAGWLVSAFADGVPPSTASAIRADIVLTAYTHLLSAHTESMPGVHLSGRTRCYWSDAQSGDVLLTLLLVETRCRCHWQNTRFAPGLFSLVARPATLRPGASSPRASFTFREP